MEAESKDTAEPVRFVPDVVEPIQTDASMKTRIAKLIVSKQLLLRERLVPVPVLHRLQCVSGCACALQTIQIQRALLVQPDDGSGCRHVTLLGLLTLRLVGLVGLWGSCLLAGGVACGEGVQGGFPVTHREDTLQPLSGPEVKRLEDCWTGRVIPYEATISMPVRTYMVQDGEIITSLEKCLRLIKINEMQGQFSLSKKKLH